MESNTWGTLAWSPPAIPSIRLARLIDQRLMIVWHREGVYTAAAVPKDWGKCLGSALRADTARRLIPILKDRRHYRILSVDTEE